MDFVLSNYWLVVPFVAIFVWISRHQEYLLANKHPSANAKKNAVLGALSTGLVVLSRLNPLGPTVTASSEITQLRVYPVKSCRGIILKNTKLTKFGIDFDRRWMFVDRSDDNKFVTIRQISQLTLIDTAFASRPDSDELDLVLSVRGKPGKESRISARPTSQWLEANCKLSEVEIWGEKTDGYMYPDSINAPFQELVGKDIALVYKGPTDRLCGGNGAPENLGRTQAINFPDMMPVLVANEASIAELNSRLKAKGVDEITIERFRPNIIVRGGEAANMPAWGEDDWKTLRISSGEKSSGGSWPWRSDPSTLTLDVAMRCARCQVPNVNPETAVKDKKEPWDTLVSYRRIDEGIKFKPCFGMLCAPRKEGPIRVGMKLDVIETTPNHVILH